MRVESIHRHTNLVQIIIQTKIIIYKEEEVEEEEQCWAWQK